MIFNPNLFDKIIDSFDVDTKSYQKNGKETFCNLYVQDIIHAYGRGTVLFPNVDIGDNLTNTWWRSYTLEPVKDKDDNVIDYDKKSYGLQVNKFKGVYLNLFDLNGTDYFAQEYGWSKLNSLVI